MFSNSHEHTGTFVVHRWLRASRRRCIVVTVTEHGIHRFFFVFTAFQWLQCSHEAVRRSRSTLGTVVIAVSTSKRLVSSTPAKYGSVSPILFCDHTGECCNARATVPLRRLCFWVDRALSFHPSFMRVSCHRKVSPIYLIIRGRLPIVRHLCVK